VGHDSGEYTVKEKLRQRGVHVDQIEPSREPTGKAYIFVNETGESHIGLVPGANDDVNEIYVDDHFDSVLNATCLLLQNEIPTETTEYLLSKLEKHPNDRPTVILDPSPIHGAERLLDHDVVDIVSPNDFEFTSLSDYFSNIQTIIHRQGPDDVIVTTQDEQFRVTPPTVDAIDATGAGDVFNGYLGASLATGADIRDAIELATYAASISTEIAGAQQSIPTLDEVTSAQSRFEDQD
ncbi:MAG: PfkB family carbohydrate kinase, partial [Halobacteriaceae archaeon]